MWILIILILIFIKHRFFWRSRYLKNEISGVSCPVCIVQSTEDRIVDPASATIAYDLVSTEDKEIHMIEAARHGILNENIGGTQDLLIDYVSRIAAREEVI